MSETSITNISNNGLNEAGVYNESLLPAAVPWLGCAGPVVIKLLSEKRGRNKIIFV